MTSATEAQKMGLKPITFLKELPGLESYKTFALYPIEGTPYFYHLQSLDDETMGLILVDPFLIFPGYSVELSSEEEEELYIKVKEDVIVLTTVTFFGKNNMTTNLAAPIVINVPKKVAKQIIVSDKIEQMRTPLPTKHSTSD